MDWAIEKLSELGVARLVVVQADRSVGRPRLERWQRIARESAKQCGRREFLALDHAQGVQAALGTLPEAGPEAGARLLLDPGGGPIGSRNLPAPVTLAVGPAGGFTVEECELFAAASFRRIRIAAPILRTETAAIGAAALVIALSQT